MRSADDDANAKAEQFRILQRIVDEQSKQVEAMEAKIRAEEKEKSERHLSIVFQQVEEARKDLAQFEKDKESARAEWETMGKQCDELNKEVETLRGELKEKDEEQEEAQAQWTTRVVSVERPLVDQRNRVDDIMEHELRELVTPHALAASARGARACALDVRRDATGGGARLRQR